MKASPDENRVFISFHGGCSRTAAFVGCPHGVDWLEFSGNTLSRCSAHSPQRQDAACIPTHGNFAPFKSGVVAATGSGLVVVDSNGVPGKEIDVKLAPGNHFMEFALDTASAIAYGIGSCLYAGGLTATVLSPAVHVEDVVRNQNERICGNVVRVTNDGRYVAISQDRKPHDRGLGEITVIDVVNRSAFRRFVVPEPPVAMVLVTESPPGD